MRTDKCSICGNQIPDGEAHKTTISRINRSVFGRKNTQLDQVKVLCQECTKKYKREQLIEKILPFGI